MIVRIKSARDGYRRCGVAHPKAATDHPADRFSAEELERLQADHVLTVELVDGELSSSSQDGGQQTSAQAASQAAKPVTKSPAKSAAKPKNGAGGKGGAGAKPAAKDAAKPGATEAPPSGQGSKE